jgi:hypothetical protein
MGEANTNHEINANEKEHRWLDYVHSWPKGSAWYSQRIRALHDPSPGRKYVRIRIFHGRTTACALLGFVRGGVSGEPQLVSGDARARYGQDCGVGSQYEMLQHWWTGHI